MTDLGCRDIDECQTGTHDCRKGALCTNAPEGSFTCGCGSGFVEAYDGSCEGIFVLLLIIRQ